MVDCQGLQGLVCWPKEIWKQFFVNTFYKYLLFIMMLCSHWLKYICNKVALKPFGRNYMTTAEGSPMSWWSCWSAAPASARAGLGCSPTPTCPTGSTTSRLTSPTPLGAAPTRCSTTPPPTRWQWQPTYSATWGTAEETDRSFQGDKTGFKSPACLWCRSSSLWVYVFDDSDEQIPPPYLAKAPVPLGALATGREVKGEGRSAQLKSQNWKYCSQ